MSERVKTSELVVDHWYVIRQGSVNRPMRLIAWSTSTTVIMIPRTGAEREVSILKIVEGWDPVENRRELLLKNGEPEIPGTIPRTRRGDPGTSVAAARVAARSCGRTAYRILAVMMDQGTLTDEHIAKLLPRIKSASSIRGRRSDLVALGYVAKHDAKGETASGNKSTRWKITQDGIRAMETHLQGATS